MKRIGIVIVTWNSEEHIDACLSAAEKRCSEIVVVDNASSDRTVELVRLHETLGLIANSTNRGFAAAVNQGVSILESDLILLVYKSANVAEGEFEAASAGEVLTFVRKPVLKDVLAAIERCAVIPATGEADLATAA